MVVSSVLRVFCGFLFVCLFVFKQQHGGEFCLTCVLWFFVCLFVYLFSPDLSRLGAKEASNPEMPKGAHIKKPQQKPALSSQRMKKRAI